MRASDVDVLGVLEHAVVVADPDWRIVRVNDAWCRALGTARPDGGDLFNAFPVLRQTPAFDAISATSMDGRARHTQIGSVSATPNGMLDLRVARTGDGHVVLELDQVPAADDVDAELTERDEENSALRTLARQMAGVSDARELLSILCDAASTQCGASGAVVIQASGDMGEIVAAAGSLSPTLARRFPLRGSLAAEVIERRTTLMAEDFSPTSRPMAREFAELEVGPIVAAPLTAHDSTRGAIAVVRGRTLPPFSHRDAQRLQIIADHAALALWKTELLEQAQAADHAKGRFLATISHELRTPLTALAGYEELLADQVLGPLQEPQRDVLERMRSVTQHLTVMIEEVLAFSSLEAGRETVRPTDFLAADLLRSVAAIIEPLARQKHLMLRLDVPDVAIRLTSDVDKIRQIIVNLAGNAVKFTDSGHIRLAVHRLGADVQFIIEDTGIGITPGDLPRLFRPFSQLDTGLTRRHGGTGLGLYISHRLARLMGGRIQVESAPEKGSVFTLVLPAG